MDTGSAWRAVTGSAAEVYQQHLVPGMFAPWASHLADLVAVKPGDACLDVACGTGVVTHVLAERVGKRGRVVGLDMNASMLAVARRMPSPTAAVEWVAADALAMPLPDASFDVVVAQHGLQQIPDRLAALREMLRVMRPGGRLGIVVWSALERSPGMAALVNALERWVGPEAAANRRAPFSISDATLLHHLITLAGFTDVHVHTRAVPTGFASAEQLVNAQLAATPLSTLGEISKEVHTAIVEDVRSALELWTADSVLRVPMEAHLALARRPD